MLDVFFVILAFSFFGAAIVAVRICDRL